jgi:hypothetical protein
VNLKTIVLTLCAGMAAAGAATAENKVFRVEVSKGGNAVPAIQKAISAAMQAGPGAEVRLGPGRFDLTGPEGAQWCLTIPNARGLTLRGEPGRTELIFHNPAQGGFFVVGCEEVWLKDVIIDYDPPPFTQGRIITADAAGGTLDLDLDEGFPSPAEPWFKIQAPYRQLGLAMDPVQRRLKARAPDFFFVSSWSSLGARRWRLQLDGAEKSKAATLAAGDRFVLEARKGEGAALFSNCNGGGVENVTVHASPSLTVALIACDAMTIRSLSVSFREGTNRLLASDGDGIHCQRNRRGPLIEACLFEGLGDDGVNIYAPPVIVRQVESERVILTASGTDIRVGDTLRIFDPRAGRIRGDARAESLVEKDGLCRIALDAPVPGIKPGGDHRDADTVFNLSASGRGYVIRNNVLRFHRRHGLLLRSGQGLIERNTFEEDGGFGVVVTNEPDWPEGPTAEDVTIRQNVFKGGGASQGYGDSPVGASILVRGCGLGRLAEQRFQRRIRIEDNTFTDPPGDAIAIGAAEDVSILSNRVNFTGSAKTRPRSAAVLLENCAGVRVEGLELTDARPNPCPAVLITASVAPGEAGVKVKGLPATLPNGQPVIVDERTR